MKLAAFSAIRGSELWCPAGQVLRSAAVFASGIAGTPPICGQPSDLTYHIHMLALLPVWWQTDILLNRSFRLSFEWESNWPPWAYLRRAYWCVCWDYCRNKTWGFGITWELLWIGSWEPVKCWGPVNYTCRKPLGKLLGACNCPWESC